MIKTFNQDPTEQELIQCMISMRKWYPERSLEQLIRALYIKEVPTNNLINELEKKQKQTKKDLILLHDFQEEQDQKCGFKKTKKIKKNHFIKQTINKSNHQITRGINNKVLNNGNKQPILDMVSILNQGVKSSIPAVFNDDREAVRMKIVELFCYKGYGVRAYYEKYGRNGEMTRDKYKNEIYIIMRRSWRSLEKNIVTDCPSSMGLLSERELRPIMTEMGHAEEWMEKNILNSFHMLLRTEFRVQYESLTQIQAQQLYDALINKAGLVSRLISKDVLIAPQHEKCADPQNFKDFVWTKQRDQQLCQAYIRFKSVEKVSQFMQQRYLNNRDNFNISQVTSRLELFFDIIFNKIGVLHENFKLKIQPILVDPKIIMHNPWAQTARINLLKFYCMQQLDLKFLYITIESVNKFLIEHQQVLEKHRLPHDLSNRNRFLTPKRVLVKREEVKIAEED